MKNFKIVLGLVYLVWGSLVFADDVIQTNVSRLQQIISSNPASLKVWHPTYGEPLEMVRQYTLDKYGSEDDFCFRYTEDADEITVGDTDAGTLEPPVAYREVSRIISSGKKNINNKDQVKRKVMHFMHKLARAGGIFGFDGEDLNEGGEPIPTLLILDPTNLLLYSISLDF